LPDPPTLWALPPAPPPPPDCRPEPPPDDIPEPPILPLNNLAPVKIPIEDELTPPLCLIAVYVKYVTPPEPLPPLFATSALDIVDTLKNLPLPPPNIVAPNPVVDLP
jgi:hypothetical protein